MTTVGHTLVGLSIGALAVPRSWRPSAKVLGGGALAGLANLPDIPLPFWGHAEYAVSHSLFVNLALVGVAVAVLWSWRALRGCIGGTPVVAAGVAAWLSHLLLDTMYNHGHGLRMFWPLSRASLALPVPWFATMQAGWTPSDHNLRVWAIELACYGPLLLVCLFVRRWRRQRRAGCPVPG